MAHQPSKVRSGVGGQAGVGPKGGAWKPWGESVWVSCLGILAGSSHRVLNTVMSQTWTQGEELQTCGVIFKSHGTTYASTSGDLCSVLGLLSRRRLRISSRAPPDPPMLLARWPRSVSQASSGGRSTRTHEIRSASYLFLSLPLALSDLVGSPTAVS